MMFDMFFFLNFESLSCFVFICFFELDIGAGCQSMLNARASAGKRKETLF